MQLDKLEKLDNIYNANTIYVDEEFKAYKATPTDPAIATFDENKALDDEKKKEKYKNISIDDLFKL